MPRRRTLRPTAMTSTLVMGPRSLKPVTGASYHHGGPTGVRPTPRDQRRSSILSVLRPLHLIVRQPSRSASYLRRVLAPLLARLRANEDRRTTFLARRTARRASLTASDVGNAAAISGWSATSVVPVRRPAYLPRTPGPSAAKSYSGRRSSGMRWLSFFIGAALTTRGWGSSHSTITGH